MLMVFLYHLDIETVSFGYIGVDIFFVISGFLMPIILDKYNAMTYIKARIKRLYPVMSFVVFTSLVIGYFLLMPGEYKSLSLSALSNLIFSSNYFFLFNTGYFDIDAKQQLLLHTWSIGNEFLAYMMIFIVWLSFGKKNLLKASIVISFSSLLYLLINSGNLHYLDPFCRMYIFFTSYIISSVVKDKAIGDVKLLVFFVFVFVLLYMVYGSEIASNYWPNNGIILIPFLICPLLMIKVSLLPKGIIRSSFMHIGNWSYSIYLWHWVVISSEFALLRNTSVFGVTEAVILFVPGFLIGIFSFYYIERNIKLCILTTCLTLFFASYIYITNGFESRVSPSIYKYTESSKMIGVKYSNDFEFQGMKIQEVSNGDNGKVLVIGDSFSQHILPIMKSSNRYREYKIYRLAQQSPDLVNNWQSVDALINKYEIDEIILSLSWAGEPLNSVKELVKIMNEKYGYNIYAIGGVPRLKEKDTLSCYLKKHSDLKYIGCGFDVDKGIPLNLVYHNQQWDYIKKSKINFRIIDAHSKLCDDTTCSLNINNEFIMRDRAHFNEKLSKETNAIIGNALFE